MQLPLLVFIFPAKLRAVTYTAEIIWNGGRNHLLNGLIIELSLTIHVWNYLSITWEAMLSVSMEWNILWRDQCRLWKHRIMCMYVTWTRSRVYSEIFFLLRTHLRNYALYPLWFGFFFCSTVRNSKYAFVIAVCSTRRNMSHHNSVSSRCFDSHSSYLVSFFFWNLRLRV